MSTTSQWTDEQIQDIIADGACCLGIKNAQRIQSAWNGEEDECMTNETLMLAEWIDSLGRFTVAGTVLYYENSVCANIDVTLMIPDLTDNMPVQVVIGTPTPIILVDTVGDFSGYTASQFIQVLVDLINAGGVYTATNNDPYLTICFNGISQYNLIGATVSIVIPGFWFLKYTSKIAREIPATPETWRLKGYSTIAPIRPVYCSVNEKLYVPNGDSINTVHPQNATVALRNKITYDFTGAVVGSTYTLTAGDVLDTGLSTLFFNDGDPLDPYGPRQFALIYDVQPPHSLYDTTQPNCPNLGDPAVNILFNQFQMSCTIIPPGYDVVTGEITFRVDSVLRNSGNFGLGVGNSIPAATIPYLCPGNIVFPKGQVGGVAIGRQDWTFRAGGTGWGTMAIYDCDLITGALTYDQTIEIPVGRASDACYFPGTELVGVVGFGNTSLQNKPPLLYPMCSIDINTDTIDTYNVTNVTIYSIKYNSVLDIAYGALGAVKIFKVDANFNYDGSFATDQIVNCQGGITYDTQGIPYVVSGFGANATSCVIKKMSGVPNPSYNIADPPFFTLFTCPDFSPANPNALTGVSFNGFTAGLTNQILNVGAGLDGLGPGGTNLIWVAPQQFSFYHDTGVLPGSFRYTITCVINALGYNNASGVVNFDVLTVTRTDLPIPPGANTVNVAIPALGAVNWTWVAFPYIKGAQDMFLHNPTGRLYITRATSVGTLLQSYDITSATNTVFDLAIQTTILASKINHYSPGYPTVVLAGPINYLTDDVGNTIVDKMLVTFGNGQSAYVFDPVTLTWGDTIVHPAAGGVATTGGMSSFSYTGDLTVNGTISQYNFFSSTPSGDPTNLELGVVSYMLENISQIFGVFAGTVIEIVSTASMNCIDNPDNLITNIKQACGCCDHEEGTVPSENVQLVLAASGTNGINANGNFIPIIP